MTVLLCTFFFIDGRGFLPFQIVNSLYTKAFSASGAMNLKYLQLAAQNAAFSIVIAWAVAKLTLQFIVMLFKHGKCIVIFLIVFAVYYCGISLALYFLESLLPFDQGIEAYLLLGFLLFALKCVTLLSRCQKPKQK